MPKITSSFLDVPIDGAKVLYLRIVPLKRICISLFTFPKSFNDKGGSREYDLSFFRILDFNVDVVDISSTIKSHTIFSESVFLESCKTREKRPTAQYREDRLRHYQLKFETGEINVVAEEFSCHVVWQV